MSPSKLVQYTLLYFDKISSGDNLTIIFHGFMQRQRLGLNTRARYLPLVWPVWQSGAAVEHNDVILTLGLHINGHVVHTPISHVSLDLGGVFTNYVCI